MRIKHLGKILVLIQFLTIAIFANVEAFLDKNTIFSGDRVKLTIKADGKDIEFPQIDEIEGFPILNTSNSTQFVYINGKMSQTKSRSYYFAPTKDIVIPSFNVKVDGKDFKTNELQLKVTKRVASRDGEPIVLELNASKLNAKVGEPIELLLKFKVKHGTKIDRVNIVPPKLENFWVEQSGREQRGIEGNYDVVTYKFLITPQKSGELKIPPTFVQIGKYVKNDNLFDDPFFDNSFFNQIKWSKVYSNGLKINVEPLPNNLELYGHFLITASVDKKVANANEPVNLTIKIEGEGNFDDIKKFNLQIPNAMIYNNEPKVEKKIINGKQKGLFIQKIAIVADSNYTIPSFELNYYDSQLKKPVTIKTNPIAITIKGVTNVGIKSKASKAKVEVAKEPDTNKQSSNIKESKEQNSTNGYLYLLVGFILGIFTMYLANQIDFKGKKKSQKPIAVQIKKAKNDKELYKLLLPYAKDGYIKNIVKKLEENIYKNAKNKIDKDELIDYFDEMILEH